MSPSLVIFFRNIVVLEPLPLHTLFTNMVPNMLSVSTYFTNPSCMSSCSDLRWKAGLRWAPVSKVRTLEWGLWHTRWRCLSVSSPTAASLPAPVNTIPSFLLGSRLALGRAAASSPASSGSTRRLLGWITQNGRQLFYLIKKLLWKNSNINKCKENITMNPPCLSSNFSNHLCTISFVPLVLSEYFKANPDIMSFHPQILHYEFLTNEDFCFNHIIIGQLHSR